MQHMSVQEPSRCRPHAGRKGRAALVRDQEVVMSGPDVKPASTFDFKLLLPSEGGIAGRRWTY